MHQTETWSPPLEIKLMDLVTRILIGIFIGALCLAAFAWFVNQPQFDIQKVEIGNAQELKHVDLKRLKELSAQEVKGNFFTADLNEMQARYKTIPWVKMATLKRVWPYQLEVTIFEYFPVAYWGAKRETASLMSESGEVFTVNEMSLVEKDLPLLRGPEGVGFAKKVWDIFQIARLEMAKLGAQIDEIGLSEQGVWELKLKDDTVIVMGSGSAEVLTVRLQDFSRTINKALEPFGKRKLLKADLRYANGYAIEVAGVKTRQKVARP